MKPLISFSLIFCLLATAVSCSLLRNTDSHIENFIIRLLDMVQRWEESGLVPPQLIEKLRSALLLAQTNWNKAKGELIEILKEIIQHLENQSTQKEELQVAIELAHLEGALSDSETQRLLATTK